VLAVRGTASLTDVMTDLECGQVELPSGIGGSTAAKATAHKGFAEAADWILEDCFKIIKDLMASIGDDAELQVVGHSLGAAVAAIVFLHLRGRLAASSSSPSASGQNPAKMRCWGIAMPPCLSSEIAVESATLGITSVVLQDDIIPRLSLHNVERLRAEIFSSDWKKMAQEDFDGSMMGALCKAGREQLWIYIGRARCYVRARHCSCRPGRRGQRRSNKAMSGEVAFNIIATWPYFVCETHRCLGICDI